MASKVEQKDNPALRGIKDILAGSAGGVAQCLSGHPLDTIKVRLQTQSKTNPKYSGMMDCVKVTIKEEGLIGLYKGIQSPLFGLTFFNAVQFLSYGQAKSLVQTGNQELSIPQYILAGALVGFTVSFVESPIDLMKSQLQVQYSGSAAKYNGLYDCAKKIFQEGGIRGVYQGLQATMIRDIPATAAYFGAYELARKGMKGPNEDLDKMAAWKILIAGGIGGMAYWASTFPLDVVKSTIQTDATKISERKYKGWMDCFKSIHQQLGWKGFFRGFAPCMVRSFPANATCFLAYEYAKKVMG
mmetsp:Transcript_15150/g.21145  ORF Transcript_15150/g.21145 Transcript_15150/m.21145 type:complete len:299 (+) Transcript_15150:86-982(+)